MGVAAGGSFLEIASSQSSRVTEGRYVESSPQTPETTGLVLILGGYPMHDAAVTMRSTA